MNTELMLYSYGFVCLAMLLFNIVYLFVQNRRGRTLAGRVSAARAVISAQARQLEKTGALSQSHAARLRSGLQRLGRLLTFDEALTGFEKEHPAQAEAYLRAAAPVFTQLAPVYGRKESEQAAYFAYFLSRHPAAAQPASDALCESLLGYLRKRNVYCHVNVLQALYAFSSPDCLKKALDLVDESGVYIHTKILTDGLLTYQGRRDELNSMLMDAFQGFSPALQLAILNYFRFGRIADRDFFYRIMTDEAQDKELRLASLRYFAAAPDREAEQQLIAFASNDDPGAWEYAAVAATALAGYPGEATNEALKKALHHRNWYVRKNAAQSLSRLGLHYHDLSEVLESKDRYAREMMMYRLEQNRRQNAGEKNRHG